MFSNPLTKNNNVVYLGWKQIDNERSYYWSCLSIM